MAQNITIKGLARLDRKLARMPRAIEEAARQAVKDEVADTARDERQFAPVDTRELVDSIQEEIADDGMSGAVYPRAKHAAFVNDGTYSHPAQPFATSAGKLSRRRFRKRTKELAEDIRRRLAWGGS